MNVFEPNPDPDAIEVPEPYTDEQAAASEGGKLAPPRILPPGDRPSEREWIDEEFDPNDAYEPDDIKRLGPSGSW